MKRVVIIGMDDKFVVYFSKYLILNNIEVYFVVRKGEELDVLEELGNKVTVVRYDDNSDYLKLFFKSIEPDVIYNLSGMYKDPAYYKNTRELLNRNYCYVIDILEALEEYSQTRFVNMINKVSDDELPEDLYSGVIKSLEHVVKYYNSNYGIEVILKERTGDEKVDMENLLRVV